MNPSSILLLLLLSLISNSSFAADGSGCPIPSDDCPCIRRPVFDSAWLQKNFPADAAAQKEYIFTPPNITYPDCAAILSSCPSNSKVVVIYNNGSLFMDGFANPFNFLNLYCDPSGPHWWATSFFMADDNLKASRLSCATKV